MERYEFESIRDEASTFGYGSFQYLDYENVKSYKIIKRDAEGILLYGFRPDAEMMELQWAARETDCLLTFLDGIKEKVIVPFVPQEWKQDFVKRGFSIYGEMRDYWINDLQSHPADDRDFSFLTSDEAEEASDVTVSCRNQSREFNGETPEWFRKWLASEEEDSQDLGIKDCAVLVHRRETGIEGIACVGIYAHESRKGPVLWVREIAVRPDCQGKGIGRKLLIQALAYGREKGACRSFLAADECNAKALALYKNVGYVPNPDEVQLDMLFHPKA